MKQTITESYFIDQIVGDEYNSISYDGAKALYEYFEELEDATGEIDFDKVEIRCQYKEYENLEAIRENHKDIKTLEDLNHKTVVIEVQNSNKLVIEAF